MLDFATKYLYVLNTKLSGLNLTKILEPDEFYNKQILDSINPYLQSSLFRSEIGQKKLLVDVGFGGGFPLLPLAHLIPDVQFVGVESKRKKVEAVNLLCGELNIKNVKLIHSRIEDIIFDQSCVLTFKAVGEAASYLSLIKNTTTDMTAFFYKGPRFLELESQSFKKINGLWKLIKNEKIEVPMTEERHLVSFQSQNVPRGTMKKLVKLSEIL